MQTKRSSTISLLVLALGLVGCGGDDTTGSEGTSGGEVDYSGPIASTDVADGADQYEMYCSGCHPGGAGSRSGPEISGKRLTPGDARRQVREGGRRMPDFGTDEIGDPELEALLAYLVTLEVVEAPAEMAAPAAAPETLPGLEE